MATRVASGGENDSTDSLLIRITSEDNIPIDELKVLLTCPLTNAAPLSPSAQTDFIPSALDTENGTNADRKDLTDDATIPLSPKAAQFDLTPEEENGENGLQCYEIGRTLGTGSHGKVKLATHKLSGVKVALKITERNTINENKEILSEIRALRSLKHPNIVRLYDVIETDRAIILVLELLEGGELFDYIMARTHLSEKDARPFARQILAGLFYCHNQRVVHRDLKLENMLLDSNGRIKIADFGYSNIYNTEAGLMDTFVGSAAYAAPEILANEQYVGPATDVWSFGVVLYSLLSGKQPFDSSGNQLLFYKKVQQAEFEMPHDFSDDAKHLIRLILQRSPSDRPTIEQICKHPWVNEGYECLPNEEESTNANSTTDLLDPSVVAILKEAGNLDISNLDLDLAVGNCTPATAAYALVSVGQKQRERTREDDDQIMAIANMLAARGSITPAHSPVVARKRAISRNNNTIPKRTSIFDSVPSRSRSTRAPKVSSCSNENFSEGEIRLFATSSTRGKKPRDRSNTVALPSTSHQNESLCNRDSAGLSESSASDEKRSWRKSFFGGSGSSGHSKKSSVVYSNGTCDDNEGITPFPQKMCKIGSQSAMVMPHVEWDCTVDNDLKSKETSANNNRLKSKSSSSKKLNDLPSPAVVREPSLNSPLSPPKRNGSMDSLPNLYTPGPLILRGDSRERIERKDSESGSRTKSVGLGVCLEMSPNPTCLDLELDILGHFAPQTTYLVPNANHPSQLVLMSDEMPPPSPVFKRKSLRQSFRRPKPNAGSVSHDDILQSSISSSANDNDFNSLTVQALTSPTVHRKSSILQHKMFHRLSRKTTKESLAPNNTMSSPDMSSSHSSYAASSSGDEGLYANLDLKARVQTLNAGMFRTATTSNKSPNKIIEEIKKACSSNKIKCMQEGTLVMCVLNLDKNKKVSRLFKDLLETGMAREATIRWEMEVVNLERLSLHGIKLKRTGGDIWLYKQVCERLIGQMRL
eukprot:CFRG3559T1